MASMLPYLWASGASTIRVGILAGFGTLAARAGLLDLSLQKGISKLCKDIMLPVLLIATVPQSLTPATLQKYLLLPLACSLYVLLGTALGALTSRMFMVNPVERRLVMASCGLPTSTGPILALLTALVAAAPGLGDLSERADVVAQGTAAVLVYSVFMNIWRWSLGWSLMGVPAWVQVELHAPGGFPSKPDPEHVTEELASKPSPTLGDRARTQCPPCTTGVADQVCLPTTASTHASSFNELPATKDETLMTASEQLTIEVEQEEMTVVHLPAQSTDKLVTDDTNDTPLSSHVVATPSSPITLKARLKKALWNPPVVCALVALVLSAITPLRPIFFNHDALLRPSITDGLASIGNAYVPMSIMVLGASLSRGPQGAASWRLVTAVGVVRLLVMPGLVVACANAMKTWLPSGRDGSVVVLVLLLESAGPPAINLGVMAVLHDHQKRETVALLFWMYLFSVLSFTAWCSVFVPIAFGS